MGEHRCLQPAGGSQLSANAVSQATFEGLGEKKFLVVGYAAALLLGLYFVESLIHLPVLNLVRAPRLETRALRLGTPRVSFVLTRACARAPR